MLADEPLDSEQIEQDFRRRADFDFVKRALPGVYLYLLAWPIIFLSTGFYQEAPTESALFGFLLSGVSVLRLIHGKSSKSVYDNHYPIWNGILIVLVLAHAVAWGSLTYLVNLDTRFAPIATIVNIIVVGIATASIHSLNTRYRLAKIYVSLLLLPALIGAILSGESLQICIIALLFWLYLMFIGDRYYREYIRAFKIERALHDNQLQLHQLNRTDPLTQVNNRRFFDEQIFKLWRDNCETQSTLGLILLDIDHFKRINDNYGHPAGDACLKNFARALSPIVEAAGGQLFRYGGEEFAVLVSEFTEPQTMALAEKLRQHTECQTNKNDQQHIAITLSAGICHLVPQTYLDHQQFIEVADKALYKAKQGGRNQVYQLHYQQDQLN